QRLERRRPVIRHRLTNLLALPERLLAQRSRELLRLGGPARIHQRAQLAGPRRDRGAVGRSAQRRRRRRRRGVRAQVGVERGEVLLDAAALLFALLLEAAFLLVTLPLPPGLGFAAGLLLPVAGRRAHGALLAVLAGAIGLRRAPRLVLARQILRLPEGVAQASIFVGVGRRRQRDQPEPSHGRRDHQSPSACASPSRPSSRSRPMSMPTGSPSR